MFHLFLRKFNSSRSNFKWSHDFYSGLTVPFKSRSISKKSSLRARKGQSHVLFSLASIGFTTLLSTVSIAAPFTNAAGYQVDPDNLCGNFPSVNLDTQFNTCVGYLRGKEDGLKMPRMAQQDKNGIIYISDMGGWSYTGGTIWALQISQNTQGQKQTQLTNLFPSFNLTMPHGLIIDPEGRVYVGTPKGIYRFQPTINGKIQINPPLELVTQAFMDPKLRVPEYASAANYNGLEKNLKNKHPLVQMVANSDFSKIYLNVGAPSDDCTKGYVTKNSQGYCDQVDGNFTNAAVYELSLSPDSNRRPGQLKVFSKGLRNSIGLAINPINKDIVQAENSMDLTDENLPFEEINILKEGAHYGWPYCHSQNRVNPAFATTVRAEDCSRNYKSPALFLPAHSAPLHLEFIAKSLVPQLNNSLLVSLHGYRASGHKIVQIKLNPDGSLQTNTQPIEVINNWEPIRGVRPAGNPVSTLTLQDGSLLIIEDKNHSILRLAPQNPNSPSRPPRPLPGPLPGVPENKFSSDQQRAFGPIAALMKTNCMSCHQNLAKNTVADFMDNLQTRGLLVKESGSSKISSSSPLIQKILKKEMPPTGLPDATYQSFTEAIQYLLQIP